MENNYPSTSSGPAATAKDFFLHLGAMVGLYASAIALMNLVFSIIDKCYPQVGLGYYYTSPNISFPTAALIIVFPIFIFLSYLLQKSYVVEPMKKEARVRKWLTYITLFVSGIILAGDLVAVLYKFLDGQDLTTAFLLKALSVVILTGFVFGYYLQDIRDKVTDKRRKLWAIVVSVAVVASIITGFSVIGSPQTQRLLRIDNQKVSDLQNIQWQIINYWQKKGSLPTELNEINDPISGFVVPNDPQQTGSSYSYNKTGAMSFELCADFNLEMQLGNRGMAIPTEPYMNGKTENWDHSSGRTCFSRTIDPQLYPVIKNR